MRIYLTARLQKRSGERYSIGFRAPKAQTFLLDRHRTRLCKPAFSCHYRCKQIHNLTVTLRRRHYKTLI